MVKDADGTFWIGSDEGGLIHVFPQKEGSLRFESFRILKLKLSYWDQVMVEFREESIKT